MHRSKENDIWSRQCSNLTLSSEWYPFLNRGVIKVATREQLEDFIAEVTQPVGD